MVCLLFFLLSVGNYDASLECFREATMRMKDYEKHPSIPLVHNSIGLVLSKTGDYKGSMHHLYVFQKQNKCRFYTGIRPPDLSLTDPFFPYPL